MFRKLFMSTNYRGDSVVDATKVMMGVAAAFVALTVLSVGISSFFGVISAGEVGVKTRLGEVVKTYQPGAYFKLPLLESMNVIDVKTRTVDYDKNGVEGDALDTSALSASSKDLQQVWANVVINFRVKPESATDIYTQYRSTDRFSTNVAEPIIRETVKAVTAEYTAAELVTKRAEISERVASILSEKLPEKGAELVQANLTNFEYSKTFSDAIESKVRAEQDALKAQNDLARIQFEAQQTVEKAKAEAESIRIQAQAITQQGGADYVKLKAIERWNGSVPTTMLPGASVPFIDLSI